jgi:hypothetical protein
MRSDFERFFNPANISLGVILFEGIYFEIHDENIHNEWVPRIK